MRQRFEDPTLCQDVHLQSPYIGIAGRQARREFIRLYELNRGLLVTEIVKGNLDPEPPEYAVAAQVDHPRARQRDDKAG
jgi:hypothetical protein